MNAEEQAVNFLKSIHPEDRNQLIFHGDADGMCGGAIIYKTLQMLNVRLISLRPLGRGENPFSDSVLSFLLEKCPQNLIVIDSGSRSGKFPGDTATLIIDHHVPDGLPEVEVFFNTYLDGTLRTASAACYDIARSVVTDSDSLIWLALTGTTGDLGIQNLPESMREGLRIYPGKVIQKIVSLINASRRHRSFQVMMAINLLIQANSPADFLQMAEKTSLEQLRQEVSTEIKRKLKIPPRISGELALINFSSPHQIQAVIAQIWANKLKNQIVIAANRDFLPGKVNFSVRSSRRVNLIEILKTYRQPGMEIGFGHEQATGGILDKDQFKLLIRELGF